MTAMLPISIDNLVSQNQNIQELLRNPLLNKDVWHSIDDLKLAVSPHQSAPTFKFAGIGQDWLKLLAKIHVLLRVQLKLSASTLFSEVHYLNKFSQFLQKYSVDYPEQINNQIFEELDYELRSQGLSNGSIAACYGVLVRFFETCRIEKWVEVNTYWFRGRRKSTQTLEINYLPQEVWNQLDQNLHNLPEPLQRMVLVIRTLGLRIGELCTLPFDCLRNRNGQWRIRFETEKYHTVDELPILSPELVAVIKEQQVYIRHHFDDSYDKLFCGHSATANSTGGKKNGAMDAMRFVPQPKVMLGHSFNNWLNRLAKKCEIRDKNGGIWHFQSHQFRRTVATIMTNAGVRDLIIQKYLRHRSPDMQKYYKHLLKQVLGDEYETLIKDKKYVDITGKIVASYKPRNPMTEFLRRRLYQITTQYGECHRASLKDPCPTVNACWRCRSWRVSKDDLPLLKEDLKRVEEELEITTRLGMVRQQQGLEGDRNILLTVIQHLEQVND